MGTTASPGVASQLGEDFLVFDAPGPPLTTEQILALLND
jgi:hypothetical protein